MLPTSILRPRIKLIADIKKFSDFYIGSNVHLRRELQKNLLHGVRVAAVHDGSKGLLVAKVLTDYGADVKHFTISGQKQSLISSRDLDLNHSDDQEYLHNVLRKTDIFIDGTSCDSDQSKMFRNLDTILRRNGQLIVAPVTEREDAFSAMQTVANIAISLYVREKHACGQVVHLQDPQNYLNSLKHYAEKHK